MPFRNCPSCSGEVFVSDDDVSVKCKHCGAVSLCEGGNFASEERAKILEAENLARIASAKDTADFSELSTTQIQQIAADIILTTAFSVSNREVAQELEIVSAECVYGMHIFKDFFSGVRDIFGGRSKVIQDTLRDARKTAMAELRREALMVGADAVIGVDLDYHEITGGGKGGMIMLVASGTAVKLSA